MSVTQMVREINQEIKEASENKPKVESESKIDLDPADQRRFIDNHIKLIDAKKRLLEVQAKADENQQEVSWLGNELSRWENLQNYWIEWRSAVFKEDFKTHYDMFNNASSMHPKIPNSDPIDYKVYVFICTNLAALVDKEMPLIEEIVKFQKLRPKIGAKFDEQDSTKYLYNHQEVLTRKIKWLNNVGINNRLVNDLTTELELFAKLWNSVYPKITEGLKTCCATQTYKNLRMNAQSKKDYETICNYWLNQEQPKTESTQIKDDQDTNLAKPLSLIICVSSIIWSIQSIRTQSIKSRNTSILVFVILTGINWFIDIKLFILGLIGAIVHFGSPVRYQGFKLNVMDLLLMIICMFGVLQS